MLGSSDRRRCQRIRKLITLNVEHAGLNANLVTTDLCLRGAYVSAPPGFRFPIGYDLHLRFRFAEPDSPTIHIAANIIRVATRPSRVTQIPGMALEFLAFSCPSGPAPLERFLTETLEASPQLQAEIVVSDHGARLTLAPRIAEAPAQSPLDRHMPATEAGHRLPGEVEANEALVRQLVTDIERRRVRRHPCHLPVTWYVVGVSVPQSGAVLNVSQRGLFIQTDQALPRIGTRISLDFPIRDAPQGADFVRIEGSIRRHWDPDTEGQRGFGIRFDKIDEQGRTGLFRLALRRLEGPRSTRRRGFHYSMRPK